MSRKHALAQTVHKGAYIQAADPAVALADEMQAKVLWLDTTSAPYVLKRRNDANDGWDTLGKLRTDVQFNTDVDGRITAASLATDAELAAAIAAHEAASDPHPVYLTQAEADALYASAGSGLTTEQVQDIVGALIASSGDIVPTYNDAGNTETLALTATMKTAFVVFEFGDGSDAASIAANQTAKVLKLPAGTITGVRIEGDASGSAVVDIQKAASGSTTYSSIAASAKPTLSSAIAAEDTTLTGWTTAITAGDKLKAVLNSVTTCKQITVVITILKS